MRGDRIKDLREAHDFTQKDVADRLEISESQVYRYEKDGIEPRADVVVKFASLFNVSTDYLLGVTDEPGYFYRDGLTVKERHAIAAWRRGDRFEAVKVIVGDE
jgi:transcriptional regulator with XRE-family HTH domain